MIPSLDPKETKTSDAKVTLPLQGWVQGLRGNNHVQFLQLRTNGEIFQVVCEKEKLGEEMFKQIKSLPQETSLVVTGTWQDNPKAPSGKELLLISFEIVGSSSDYPITPKEHGPDFLHNHRHLWLRSKRQLAIQRVRSELSFAIREFFRNDGYTLIDTPILTGSIGESAGTLFSTEYFDLGQAYLAQTGQLYLETAAFAHSKVYCFGPTFRAEKSKTKRHLTEFWMLEAETAFLGQEGNLDLQERFVKSVLKTTIERTREDLKTLDRDPQPLLNYLEKPFPRVDYKEAINILQSAGEAITWGEDINAEREQILTNHYGTAIFIQNFPRAIKAFYMKQNPNDPKTVLSADLIAPDGIGEIIGGSEREESYEKIVERLQEEGLPPEDYSWYLDLRKYGSVPHAGFGMGLERVIAWVCGLPHIRECIPFPRMIYRLTP
ncbi:asparagine--tRNA ligase [Leptospira yanagawae serovar Saopaulo str. Sao Paulo = ATCC 700523]|uniref:Asparagine--tRNA ligase n=1 Tax=Leptospira yanagawae serovar Saopaulo str. Sao Paulo = ATCC 700523 TaxID=1249483 RepID=A0A5E8HBD4_9LEPT|nr:asparagine--tRNA ligase [Leptospira yanagawae]EOQ88077.1 asparagine--tRNA ligase [Leptospira yanagawae serovar Saopaulo str. Sao Paulo = ATCC 700523]